MSMREDIEQAIATLEKIERERGVENHWLWEIPASEVYFDGEDPRVPLVRFGPDPILQNAVLPMLTILRDSLVSIEAVGEGPRAPLGVPNAHALAEAINATPMHDPEQVAP